MTRSWQSANELVNPHATRALWPMITSGIPGRVTPVDSKSSPARTCAAYQTDGTLGARCGSLQRSGRPEAVRLPLTTHELLPPPAPGIHRDVSWNMAASAARFSPAPATEAVSARMTGLAAG